MSSRKFLLTLSFTLVIIFSILQLLADVFYFYWIYWWFDWFMHFLAGVTGGLAAFWVLYYGGFHTYHSRRAIVITIWVFISVMFAGLVWELLEYVLDLTQAHEDVYYKDVLHDLIADAAGALVGTYIGLRKTIFKNA